MRHIFINGNAKKIGLREINVNIGKNKDNLRIDVLEINRQKNYLVGYEVKSCIEDFRTDKKWNKYLSLVNKLYFVFDSKTYEDHREEIINKIDDKAGIYVYNASCGWVSFIVDGKQNNIVDKQEDFYRIILFNYLLRNAMRAFNKGVDL
jgi:hypothetical protein